MFALLVIALVSIAAIAAMGALADSGLRWWSAFGRLRRDLAMDFQPETAGQLRPALNVGYSGFGRAGSPRHARRTFSRAA